MVWRHPHDPQIFRRKRWKFTGQSLFLSDIIHQYTLFFTMMILTCIIFVFLTLLCFSLSIYLDAGRITIWGYLPAILFSLIFTYLPGEYLPKFVGVFIAAVILMLKLLYGYLKRQKFSAKDYINLKNKDEGNITE
jgi:hypothetical protein